MDKTEKPMETKLIINLESFLEGLYDYPETFFYRGQASVDFRLIPSIGRNVAEDKKNVLLQYEREIFEDFKRKYSMFTDVRPKNDMEFLFLAQHYGLPTRLLDWTYNPLIALYFACCSHRDKDGVVFQSYPFSHKVFQPDIHDILSFDSYTFLIPNITDVRYKNQNGLFVLFPEPWNDNFGHISVKFIIPATAKCNILNKLSKIGITKSFIMPSLDSLCHDIVNIHKVRYPHLAK